MTVDERRQALEHVRRQMAMLTEQDEFRDEGRTDHGMRLLILADAVDALAGVVLELLSGAE